MSIELPKKCPRKEKDCEPYALLMSTCKVSFNCVGENDGTTRAISQDKYRVCFKNETLDEMTDYDKRDIIETMSVLAQGLSIIENIETNNKIDEKK